MAAESQMLTTQGLLWGQFITQPSESSPNFHIGLLDMTPNTTIGMTSHPMNSVLNFLICTAES